MGTNFRCVTLFSGGLDSTALIHFYKESGFFVSGLFVDFGQVAAKKELSAIDKIARYYGIKYDVVTFKEKLGIFRKGEIIGRNLLLVSIALMKYQYNCDVISIGIHDGTNYFDSKEQFLNQTNKLFEAYSNYKVQLQAPFIHLNKQGIWNYILENKIPFDLTYSCENGENQPCDTCKSCMDLKKLYAQLDCKRN